jgi:Tfp pilus assembly protein PilO
MTSSLLAKPQYKYRLLATIVPVALLIISVILLSMSASNITASRQHKTDAIIKNQTAEEAQSLNQFVVDNLTSLEKMSMAIPSESMMVGVIQDIESVVYQFDPTGTVKLSGQNPVRSGLDLIIPITILVRSNPAQITQLIQEINTLPYITQLLNLDSQIAGDEAQTIINLRMYVQEPFIGY